MATGIKTAWCQTSGEGPASNVVRIFKSKKAAYASGEVVWEVTRAWAVASIRHQIFVRSDGDCEQCGSPITESSGHMHERKHRGRGGEISLENSVFICAICHSYNHRARNPRWGEEIK